MLRVISLYLCRIIISFFFLLLSFSSLFYNIAYTRLSIISKILLFEKNDMPLDEKVVVFDGSFQCWCKKQQQQLNVLYGGDHKI